VEHDGRIERSRDGGQSWEGASGSLPVPWPRTQVERFIRVGEELLAILADGRLLAAPLESLAWQPILADAGAVNAATLAGDDE
jgi:hypothetical protein